MYARKNSGQTLHAMMAPLAPATKTRSVLKRAGYALLAVLIAFALIPLGAFSEKAYADSAWLDVGRSVPYGGYSTTEFWVNGVIAYCGQPSKVTPSSGSYTKVPAYSLNTDGTDSSGYNVAMCLYYGYGGPGFNPAMWPAHDHAGNPMSRDMYIAATHILISDAFAHNAIAAVSGTSAQFQNWVYNNILIYDGPTKGTYTRYGVQANMMDYDYSNPMPASFVNACFCMSTGSGTQVIVGSNPGGLIELYKSSANTDITNGNANYTLRNARYDIFSDHACTRKLQQSYTTAAGRATYFISPGTYYAKEAVSPTGYARDERVYTVSVSNGGSSRLDVKDVPQSCAPDMVLEKYDSELGYADAGNVPQGSASLADAQFSVAYYAGYYDSVERATASGAAARNWVVRTDETGVAKLEDAYKVSGDDFYFNSEGKPALPLGTYVIIEVAPPEGYLNEDAPVFLKHVTADGTVEQALYEALHVDDQVMRGNIFMEKRDAESGLFTPLGAASLDGATFQVVNDSAQAVIVDGTLCAPGDACATLTIADNKAELPERSLPYGRYLIQEVAAGEGYQVTDGLPKAFDITAENETVRFTDDLAFYNPVNRGDLQLVKVHDVDMQRLVGVPFRITSETTGESHVMVTNENGELNTSALRAAHTHNTNANDDVVDGDHDRSAGIWFGLTQEGFTVPPDDSMGALPYDTYTIEELRCPANDGYTLLRMEHIGVRQNEAVVNLGTLQNTNPSITTYAIDAVDGDKLVMAEPGARVIDRVEYANVFPGKEYTLTATVMDREGEEPARDAEGDVVEARLSFTPDDVSGVVDVPIPADLTGFGNAQLVVFEELTCGGEVVAEHKEIADSGQTFWTKAPALKTSATDGADGDKRIVASQQCTIVDAVSYSNLVPGTEYTLQGVLMMRTGGADDAGGTGDAGDASGAAAGGATELLDASNNTVTRTVTFTPDAPSGSLEITFAFDGSSLPNTCDIIVFETLFKDGTMVATHTDINDAAQTVEFRYPTIETAATDKHDGDKEVAGDVNSVISDSVRLNNLVPQKAYMLYGVLVDKNAADVDWDAIMTAADSNGIGTASENAPDGPFPWIAVAKASVTSDSGTAMVDMDYALDQHGGGHAELFSGEAVVLNILLEDGRIIAQHCNPENDDQSVTVIPPAVVTEALDFSDGDHNIMPSKDMVVLDTVYYTGLISGQEYEIRGTLMDKAAHTQLTIDDKIIEESLTFTPNNSDGTITVALPVDTSKLPVGTEIVVFEQIYKDGEPIADDKDFGNMNETVRVNRNLKSTAYAKTGIPYQLVPLAVGLLIAGGLPLAYWAARRWYTRTNNQR